MPQIQKFNYNDFKILDTGDLFINIWSYSYNLKNVCKKNCKFCNSYRRYCCDILKKRWNSKWGDYDYIMDKIFRNDDENFINLGEYSSERKHLITYHLINIEKANF